MKKTVRNIVKGMNVNLTIIRAGAYTDYYIDSPSGLRIHLERDGRKEIGENRVNYNVRFNFGDTFVNNTPYDAVPYELNTGEHGHELLRNGKRAFLSIDGVEKIIKSYFD